MPYETEAEELARLQAQRGRDMELRKERDKKRKADRATKFSDEEIKEVIEAARSSLKYQWESVGLAEIGAAVTVQSMIAYNNMIDARVERSLAQDAH